MTRTVRWLFAATLATLLPHSGRAATPHRETVAVLELRSRLVGPERKLVDVAALGEQVRDVARRTMPTAVVLDREQKPAGRDECAGDCALNAARSAGATLLVSGEVLRVEQGFLVSLELRATASGKLVSNASASSNTPEELVDSVASASVDLFRGLKAAAALAAVLGAVSLPDVPAAAEPLRESGVVDLDIDPNVLVAYDKARSIEANGEERPDEAAAAWRAVAEPGAGNPLRQMATARAKQWQDYADGKRAYQAQLAKDTDRLRKVLPLGSVSDTTKIDLLVRYARVYGVDKATPLLASLPAAVVRDRAALALGCEGKTASSCVALARAADDAKDPKSAIAYLDRACTLDDVAACAEAGDRWLRPDERDVSRAIPALQHGCSAGGAAACARLARVYEEGDGTNANPALAAEMRDKACTAGDGNSCRRLACTVDGNAPAAEQARAAELWQKGCAHGDAASCAVAAAGQEASPAIEEKPAVRQQVDEALAGTQRGSRGGRPASLTLAAGSETAGTAALSSEARATYDSRSRTGFTLISLGVIAAGGAAFLALQNGSGEHEHGDYGGAYRQGSSRTGFAILLGAVGLATAGTGIGVLLSRPDPATPQLSLGVAPGRVLLSGTMP